MNWRVLQKTVLFIVFALINFIAVSLLGTFHKDHFVSSGKDTASLEEKKRKEKTGHERTESKAESLVEIVTGFV